MEKILKNWVSFVEVTLMINAHRFAETKKVLKYQCCTKETWENNNQYCNTNINKCLYECFST